MATQPHELQPYTSNLPSVAPHRRSGKGINITVAERAISVAVGSFLALYGLQRRSVPGLLLGGAGGLLVTRGITGHSRAYERIGISSLGPVEIEKSLTIHRSPQEVYDFWRRIENLPKFLRHLESVTPLGGNRFHWVARPAIPGGLRIEWESEFTEDRPGEVLAWRSLPGSRIETYGRVLFKAAPGKRGTELHVKMGYTTPAGRSLAQLMTPLSTRILREEIRCVKHVLEAGEIPTTDGQSSARDA